MDSKIRVGVISDNRIFLNGLKKLISEIGRYEIVLSNGRKDELIRVYDSPENEPELFLINVDEMSADTELLISTIKGVYPNVKVLLMSNYNNHYNILKALKYGSNGYVARYCNVNELHKALLSVYYTDVYYNESYKGLKLAMPDRHLIDAITNITELERDALALFATEMSYKEIACSMNTTIEMIEAYKELLFEKFKVKSRVGLVVWAYAIGELNMQKKAV